MLRMLGWRRVITALLLGTLLALSATQLTQAKSTSHTNKGGNALQAAICFARAGGPAKHSFSGGIGAGGSAECHVDRSTPALLHVTISIYRDGNLLSSSTSSGLSFLEEIPGFPGKSPLGVSVETETACSLSSQYKAVLSVTGTFRGSAIQIAPIEKVAYIEC